MLYQDILARIYIYILVQLNLHVHVLEKLFGSLYFTQPRIGGILFNLPFDTRVKKIVEKECCIFG